MIQNNEPHEQQDQAFPSAPSDLSHPSGQSNSAGELNQESQSEPSQTPEQSDLRNLSEQTHPSEQPVRNEQADPGRTIDSSRPSDSNEKTNPPAQSEPSQNEGQKGRNSSSGRGNQGHRARTILVRYGKLGFVGQFTHNERQIPPTDVHVVIKTDRGMELGQVISPFVQCKGKNVFSGEKVEQYYQLSGPDYPLNTNGKVVRIASQEDLNEQRHLDKNAIEELKYCQSLADKMNLPMKLVTSEHLFGGDRIVFYFMADGRVDFRDLVKQLAQEYQTRIEMRQVGARDEARLVADIETCGRECCCKNFLKVLQPVNMRMAKLQKATLDPTKISGSCGRLKCCLRFEDEVYLDLNKRLPRRGSCVLTAEGPGMIMDTHVLTQLVKVHLDSGRIIAVRVDELKQTNYRRTPEEQKKLEKQAEGRSAPPARGERKEKTEAVKAEAEVVAEEEPLAQEAEEAAEPKESSAAEENKQQPKSKKRRRRRRRKPGGGNREGGGGGGNPPAGNG